MAWFFSATIFQRRKDIFSPEIYKGRRVILILSGIYVIGCAFRTFLPRIDLERVCLIGSWFSSMMIGRSVATVAEICFIAQSAILLNEGARSTQVKFAIIVSWLLVPIILVAEGFSWYAMLSTNYFGSVIEESLWTVCAFLLVISFLLIWPRVYNNKQRYFLLAMITYGVGFIIFMIGVDVPMYFSRWQMDSANGVEYLSMVEGLLDASLKCIVNFDWQVWREEIPWMTLYFSIAVWISLALAHAPVIQSKVGVLTKGKKIIFEPKK